VGVPPRASSFPSVLLGLLLLIGCGDDDPIPTDTDAATGSGSGSSVTAPTTGDDDGASSTPMEPPADGTDDTTTGDADGSSGEPASFACPPSPFEMQCDPETLDCPTGRHCLPWSTDGIGTNAAVCGELAPAPVARFGACTADPEACTDDCEVGTYCQRDDADDLGGVCLGVCGGAGDPGCLADEVCVACADCIVGTCLPSCDPLAPQCPDGAPTCAQLGPGGYACVPGDPIGNGGPGDACADLAACAPGHVCVNADVVGDACRDTACCTELCDLDDGDPGCSDGEHVCVPYYLPGKAPDGLDHVGMCALPSADPCLVPGACPPPGIDDTYPWCSPSNEGACRGESLGGYGDAKACEGGCLCASSCTVDDDCPDPATGTATPDCVEAPLGPGSATSCMLSCESGESCPDGMSCTDVLTGEPLCIWVTPLPPEDC
jgi:hypothetical protein